MKMIGNCEEAVLLGKVRPDEGKEKQKPIAFMS
jgi:hypothetical protein